MWVYYVFRNSQQTGQECHLQFSCWRTREQVWLGLNNLLSFWKDAPLIWRQGQEREQFYTENEITTSMEEGLVGWKNMVSAMEKV
ncbi:hypothetical protein L3X38_023500 [Prunus dulcis]|uniref:Uncharacterized protein n=1 Tax=Prunus dulcis TaxID=3755 RepID=A0AAD4Z5L9_PRUDU|nr:hypothetical protein L3X38_023500 [Prunus dulcis]